MNKKQAQKIIQYLIYLAATWGREMKETILDLESKHWAFSLTTNTLMSSFFIIVM